MKFQPEAAFKVNINEKLEIGVTSGLGFRTKINDDKEENELDKSLSISFYGQYSGINIRISNELFYYGIYNSEGYNLAIAAGYSYAFKLK